MATRNPIQLLIDLGVATEASRKNIQATLDAIKKDLKLDIDIKVNGAFNNLKNDIKSASTEVDGLNRKIKDVGNNKQGKVFSGLQAEITEGIRSIEDLKKRLDSNGMKYTLNFDVDRNGQKVVRNVITEVKNELGEISKLTITPKIDKNGITSFKEIRESLTNTGKFNLTENINKATKELEKFARQGELTVVEYDRLKQSIQSAPDNKALTKIVESMREMNKEASHDNKIVKAFQTVEPAVESLNNKLKRLQQTYNIKSDNPLLTSITTSIQKINSMDIKSTADITRLNDAVSTTNKKIAELSSSSEHMQKFNNAIKTANNTLDKMQHHAAISTDEFNKFKASIASVPSGELKQVNKLIDDMNKKLSQANKAKGLESDLRRQSEILSKMVADLTRTEHMYKKTFDKSGAAELTKEIQKLNQQQNIGLHNIQDYINRVDQARKQVRQFTQEQIQASRNSLSVLDSFKIAMERFPINIQSGLNSLNC